VQVIVQVIVPICVQVIVHICVQEHGCIRNKKCTLVLIDMEK